MCLLWCRTQAWMLLLMIITPKVYYLYSNLQEIHVQFVGNLISRGGILHIKEREKLMCTLVCIVLSFLEKVAYTEWSYILQAYQVKYLFAKKSLMIFVTKCNSQLKKSKTKIRGLSYKMHTMMTLLKRKYKKSNLPQMWVRVRHP